MLILSLTLFSSKSWVIFPCKMKMLVLPGLPEGWDNTHLLYQFMWVRRQSRYNFFSWSSSGSPTRLPRRCHPWLGSSEGLTGAKICLQVHVLVRKVPFLCGCGTEGFSIWMVGTLCSLPYEPLKDDCSLQQLFQGKRVISKEEVSCKPIKGVVSHHVCLLVRSKSRVPSTRVWLTENHLGGCQLELIFTFCLHTQKLLTLPSIPFLPALYSLVHSSLGSVFFPRFTEI